MVEAQRGLIAATGITSGVDGEHHHYNSDAVDPRIGDHGSRVGVGITGIGRGSRWPRASAVLLTDLD
jgi:hypothetical protein